MNQPRKTVASEMPSVAELLRASLRQKLLFGHFDEPLDDYGQRLVRVILAEVEQSDARLEAQQQTLVAAVQSALKLAREATNGWACYAKRKMEHTDIARLHREIAALDR